MPKLKFKFEFDESDISYIEQLNTQYFKSLLSLQKTYFEQVGRIKAMIKRSGADQNLDIEKDISRVDK